MMKMLYVGNIPYESTESELRLLFEQHGTVHSIKLINDRNTGRPRGFGFVEMEAEAGTMAINALNNAIFLGRNLKVNEARLRKPQPHFTRHPKH